MPWITIKFDLFLQTNFRDSHYVAKEKKTVQLERGEPSPFSKILGFHLPYYLNVEYLKKPSFWESEFSVSFEKPYTIEEERISTLRLTKEQVKKHYQDYYYPGNMQVYVSGRFNPKETLKLIQDTFGKMKPRDGKTMLPLPAPKPRKHAFAELAVVDQNPNISMGFKVWDLNYTEEMVIRSYTNFLAHKLMKLFRNERGETYTVSDSISLYKGFGWAVIDLEAPKQAFDKIVERIKKQLRDDIQNGQMTQKETLESIDLLLNKYILYGKGASEMMWMAEDLYDVYIDYGIWTTPFEVFRNLKVSEYHAILEKHFVPSHSYQYLKRPPIFFVYDTFLFLILTVFISLYVLRKFLLKTFSHNKIKWIRNVYSPPLKLFEIFFTLISYFICRHLIHYNDVFIFNHHWIQSSVLMSGYLSIAAKGILIILSFQFVYLFIPRKLMVVGKKLIIKSPSYYSRHIYLSDIKSVTATSPFRWYFKIFKMDQYFLHTQLKFWKKGLAIELKNDKFMYFDIKDANQAATELKTFLDEEYHEDNEVAA